MPLKTIKYSQRLGDIIRCLPACKHLAEQGHEVYFDCLAQYQEVFNLVSYAKAGHNQGDIIDLEVWPKKYEAYRKSKKTWIDFVYSHPELRGAKKTEIVLDKIDEKPAEGFPEKYNLIAPFGISQGFRHDPLQIITQAAKEFGKESVIVLCPKEIVITGLKTYTAPSVEQMAKAIRGAEEFWAINSSPIAIASAVRVGKETRFWGQQGEFETDNIHHFEGLFRMD